MSTPTAHHRLPAPIEAAAQRIKQAARQAVERSIESLGLAALSAATVSQRSEILATQFEMDRKSALFSLTFDETFETRLRSDCLSRETQDAVATNWAELSLMDDHELEIKVAAERFGLQMAHACEWELRELGAYLVSVLTTAGLAPDLNPLRPELVGLAMIRATEATTTNLDSRRILSAELVRSLSAMLGSTYAAIVTDLRGMGIQPAGLTVRLTESRASAGPNSESDAQLDNDHGANARTGKTVDTGGTRSDRSSRDGLVPSTSGAALSSGRDARQGASTQLGQVDASMMRLIRRLTHVDSGALSPSSDTGSRTNANVDADAVIEASLEGMAPNLIHRHRDELRAASQGAIDHMVIDVIGSLFDQILSDPKVPPQMARQIARLQLPVLRAALGDPAFFSSRRHPVRRFVNRIASVGSALEDFDDDRGQRFLAKVQALVQAVVQGDFEQMALYESQLDALEAFVADEAMDEAGGAAAVLQAREDQLRLQGLYAQQLSGAMKDLETPAFLRDFVAHVWSQVLLTAAAASGPDSEAVERMRHTGRELLMSVQPKATPAQRKAFLTELPKLMQALNDGMALIAWDDAARRAFFAQLLPAHAEALKNTGARTLDFNLMAKRVEGVLDQRLPSRADLSLAPRATPSEHSEQALVAPFNADEAQQVGLVTEASVDWNGQVDIDLSQEPEPSNAEVQIQGLPTLSDADEPTRGKTLVDHVQIGFAYQMHLQGQWQKVRLVHVSPARTFFVFRHGSKQRQAISLTHRMLTRLCETERMRAFESAYLIERATARARRQLADLGTRASV